MSLVQLITAVGSREDAVRMARAAVGERVAACVQVIGPVTSVYRWEGTLREDQEFVCLMKAPSEGLERLLRFVRESHPYDTPEISELPAGFVDERYLAWARAETAT
jgi:periplasmic divalent cation tolerance protein